MGLTTKSRFPTFQGPTQAVVPTPTFSGKLTDVAADSINPYTSVGPGVGGAGQTHDDVYNPVTGDPYYQLVSLLLSMDGTNGSTTFTDLGPKAHTVAANGNAQVTTTTPKYGTGALLLDGSGDYLQVTASDTDSMVFGTNNLTIEGWMNIPSLPSNGALFSNRASGGTTLIIGYGTSYANGLYVHSDTTQHINGNVTIPLNTWNHWAYTVENGTQKLWFNGNLLGSAANYDKSSTNSFRIGFDGTRNVASAFNGKMDDVRVTKNVARYTANFTPPAEPHKTTQATVTDANFANVSLQLKFNGTNGATSTTDSSNNGFTVTPTGTFTLTETQARFQQSGNFPGSTYLNVADNAALRMGSGDWTIEGWARSTTTSGLARFITKDNTAANGYSEYLIYRNGGSWQFYSSSNGSAWDIASALSLGTVQVNRWTHLAVTRSGNDIRAFNNGILTGSTTYSGSLWDSTGMPLQIGRYVGNAQYFNGQMDDIRITKGIARYTANFIPPVELPN